MHIRPLSLRKRVFGVLMLAGCLFCLWGKPAQAGSPPTITVTNNADSGAGSLRQAIADSVADGEIAFDAALAGQTITLASQLTIDKNLTIYGGANNITVSGNNAVRVFYVNPGFNFNLTNLTVTKGYAGTMGMGGGIYSGGALTVTNSTISGNSAYVGGGIYSGGTLIVTGSTFTGNSAPFGSGGGIHNDGASTVTNSTFIGNSAPSGEGGGISNFSAFSTVTNSTFTGNSADFGGGIVNRHTLTVTNSTLSSNSAGSAGGGGGICNYYILTVTNSTISGNSAASGGGIYNYGTSTVTVTNSIVANSTSGGNCDGAITDGGHNLVDDDSCGAGFINSSSILFGSLGDYGGPTQTMPLLPGSDAIDTGDAGSCSATDQRGKSRVGTCDIGAFESQGFTLAKTGGDSQSATVSTAFALPLALTVASAYGEPVDGGQVTFTAPTSGASAAITGSPAAISGGAASATATANATAGGPYNVTASAAGASNVNFSLTNLDLITTTTTSVESTTTTTSVEPTTTTTTIACASSITVTSNADSGAGSLRQAISDACADGAITFDASLDGQTITLASTLTIDKNLTIDGEANSITVSGDDAVRVFEVKSDITFNLTNLTVTKGNAAYNGGGIYIDFGSVNITNSTFSGNSAGYDGGGIFIDDLGSVNVTNSTFSGNSAGDDGGGVVNTGTLTVTNSTLSGNSADGGGGGIVNRGTMTLTNSTLSGNSADDDGGGIVNDTGTLTVTNSTLSGNSAGYGGRDIVSDIGTVTVTNSILASSDSGGDICDGTITDGGHNLVDDDTCGAGFIVSSSILLAPLGDYGGPTQTMPLLPGSEAIDAGDSAACSAAPVSGLDQRGVARGTACDIGAFESQGFTLAKTGGDSQSATVNAKFAQPLALTVASAYSEPVDGGEVTFTAPASGASTNPATDTHTIHGDAVLYSATANATAGGPYVVTASAAGVAGAANVYFSLTNVPCVPSITVTSTADSGAGSLRQAIVDVCPDGTITFDASLAGQTITLTSDQLLIDKNLTIDGEANSITVSGDNAVRVFEVTSDVTFNLTNLTVTKGNAVSDSGGGIFNDEGTVIVTNSTFTGNSADAGGGIYSNGTLTVTNSTFSGNSAQWGGGIFNNGTLTVTGSTFTGNSATSGGGGILNNDTLTVTNSTFTDNSASMGGGILNGKGTGAVTHVSFAGNSATMGGGIFNVETLTVANSTFTGNNGGDYGGGIFNTGTLTMSNSTLSGNSAVVGGGIYNYNDVDIIATVTNSIVGNSTSGGNCDGTITDGGHNMVDDDTCGAGFTNSSSILLGPLGDYGGPTQTMPLLPGSDAIDAGDTGSCSATDQRGESRVGPCDIGAFESQGFTLAKTGGDSQSATVSTAFALPLALSVTSAYGEPVDGGQVTFTEPASGASAAITASPATISGGAASVTATANATAGGPYTVTASATGAASVDFSLTNLDLITTTTTSVAPTTTTTSVEPTTTTTTSIEPTTTTTSVEPTTTTTTIVCAAGITVTSNADSAAGSLRQAIADACADGAITFDAALAGQTITLASQLTIDKSLTIDGEANTITVSGDNATRVFYVTSDVTFNLTNLTVTKGFASTGGGILNGGTVIVTNSTFTGNSADAGGGIYSEETLTVTGSTFTGNSADDGGGGIFSAGTLTVTGSTFTGNSADGGGGIYTIGTLTLTNSTFTCNSASMGGGILNGKCTGAVTNVSFTGNSATMGGGILNMETLTVANSTFTANNGGDYGGGICNIGALTVTNSTLSGNSATINGGGIYNYNDEDIIVTVTNSIVANSTSGGNCNGTITDGGHNLVDDDSCGAGFTNSSSILLGPLGDYGGPTQTMPLLPGSDAIDAGDAGSCSATDQRVKSRVGACDIGAFESQGFTLNVSGGNNQSAEVNTAFAAPLSLTVTADNASEPVDGGQIIFTAPASGASAAITGSPATIVGGSVSVTARANGTAGSYTLIAEAAGANQLSFNLENSALPVTTTTTTAPGTTTTTTAPETTTTTTTTPVRDGCLTVVPAKVTRLLWGDSVVEKELQAKNGDKQLDPEAIIALLRIAGYAIPLQGFIMIGDSDTVFTRQDRPEWNTDEIHTLLKLKLRNRIMFALVFINPFTAEAGTYTVTAGDCAGEVELLAP